MAALKARSLALLTFLGGPLLALSLWLGGELLRPLPPTVTPRPTPAFTPTPLGGGGGLIAFETHRDGNGEIYVVRADGISAVNVTRRPGHDYAPSWSPDGRRLAFLSGQDLALRVYVLDIATALRGQGVPQALTRAPGGMHLWFQTPLTWSPDSRSIVMRGLVLDGPIRLDDERTALYRIDLGSLALAPLEVGIRAMRTGLGPHRGQDVKWSPDGAHLAFLAGQDSPPALYVAASAGGRAGRVSEASLSGVGAFAWSPDSGRLAYWLNDVRRGGTYRDELIMVDADGAAPRTVLTWERPNPHRYLSLEWSRDGVRLLFSVQELGPAGIQHTLYLAYVDGSSLTRLASLPPGDSSPTWSPDGKWIAYADSADILLLNVAGAFRDPGSLRPVMLTDGGPGSNPQWQP